VSAPLVIGDIALSFDELLRAAHAARTAPAIVAHNRVDTLIQIASALHGGWVLGLLHPALPGEHAEQRARLSAASGDGLILFTSGSSGISKGVHLSAAALRASALGSHHLVPFEPGDRWLCPLPLAHMGGLGVFLRAYFTRATMLLAPGFSIESMTERFRRDAPTHISLVPTMLHRLVEAKVAAPRSLRAVLIGGAALAPDLATRAADLGYPLLPSYGMTETCGLILAAGKVMPGTELRLRDGILQVRGPTLLSGYLPPHDHLSPGEWFDTGDRARCDSEGWQILGRADDTIISGGENIDPRAVEAALLEVAGVSAACVVGLDDAHWGQSVAAAVVASPAGRARLEEGAPAKLGFRRPKHYRFVDALPLNANGKVKRQTIKQLFS
jgi:O-succinylbenzoic acid--CoA ligase